MLCHDSRFTVITTLNNERGTMKSSEVIVTTKISKTWSSGKRNVLKDITVYEIFTIPMFIWKVSLTPFEVQQSSLIIVCVLDNVSCYASSVTFYKKQKVQHMLHGSPH